MFDLVVMSVLFDWGTKNTKKKKRDLGYCDGSHRTSYKLFGGFWTIRGLRFLMTESKFSWFSRINKFLVLLRIPVEQVGNYYCPPCVVVRSGA